MYNLFVNKNKFGVKSLALHKKLKGKVEISPKYKIRTREDLSILYTPGVGAVSSYIAKNVRKTGEYTMKNNSVFGGNSLFAHERHTCGRFPKLA